MTNIVKTLQILHLWRPAQTLSNRLSRTQRMRFYSQFIQPNNLCFDIGANIGNRSDIFLRLGAKVIAVEPQDDPYKILVKRYGKNTNFTAINKGVGAVEAYADMNICFADGASSMSSEWIAKVRESGRFPDDYEWGKKVSIPLTTLDALIAQFGMPDFCKVDVEGYEYQVVRGLSKAIPMMAIEFTPEIITTTISVIKHLGTLGCYEFNYALGENLQLCFNKWVDEERISVCVQGAKDYGDLYCRLIKSPNGVF